MKLIPYRNDRVVPGTNAMLRRCLEGKPPSKLEKSITFAIVYVLVFAMVVLAIINSH